MTADPASHRRGTQRRGGPRGSHQPRLRTSEETSAGGLVVDTSASVPLVALIARFDRRGQLAWSLPKGHLEAGETPEQAAIREIIEETGIVGEILAPLGIIDFWFMTPQKRIHKTVHHFLLRAVGGELSDEDIEVEQVEWVPLPEVGDRLRYPDERRLLVTVDDMLLQEPGLLGGNRR
ncbi:MAG: NUDIX hydrolase [Actinomycetales bacterium]